jgi:dimethylhistidine N-methyltransferase
MHRGSRVKGDRSLLTHTPQPDDAPPGHAFLHDLQNALAMKPHCISPKYFYDAMGSQLFDRICELPEYYPTRTELGILKRHANDIAELVGPNAEIIEFGAGSLHKVRLLLAALDRPARYLPIDISCAHLMSASRSLARDFPNLRVQPIAADYTQLLLLPQALEHTGHRVGFFPGSSIGNFTPQERFQFLKTAAQVLQGGSLLLGVDLAKSPATLHAAYNDAQGVTATFNLNLLARANRELGCNFALPQFAHYAFYNAPQRRIEMHLISQCRQQVWVANQCYELAKGDTLHTENSYKFIIEDLHDQSIQAGFTPGPVWTDANQLFSVCWLYAPH